MFKMHSCLRVVLERHNSALMEDDYLMFVSFILSHRTLQNGEYYGKIN